MLQAGEAVAASDAVKAKVAGVEFTLTEPKSCEREAKANDDAVAHSKAALNRVEASSVACELRRVSAQKQS